MDEGFLRLSRRFFSNEMWKVAREFSECEAWLDLIQSARFDATDKAHGELIGGREISYTRGQYPASISFLMKRWKWSEKKVRYFLSKLKKKGMITTCNKQGMNVITLCNYDEYNPVKGEARDIDRGVDNNKEINEIRSSLGELRAELRATVEKLGQTKGNKKKKDKEDIKESPNGDKKEAEASSPASLNPDYLKFNDWLKRKAPFCSNPKNFSSQITEAEFLKLKEKYTGKQIADIIEQIENRKDLRKRYTNLYRTVLNWAKKEYGS